MRGFSLAGVVVMCAAVGLTTAVEASSQVKQQGLASWYKMGTQTANGEHYDPMGITAAHPSLPFDTKVRVTYPESGKSVVVRINDRGPFAGGRIIDLSLGAAKAIGLVKAGVAPVKIAVVGSAAEAEQTSAPKPKSGGAEKKSTTNFRSTPQRWAHREFAHR